MNEYNFKQLSMTSLYSGLFGPTKQELEIAAREQSYINTIEQLREENEKLYNKNQQLENEILNNNLQISAIKSELCECKMYINKLESQKLDATHNEKSPNNCFCVLI